VRFCGLHLRAVRPGGRVVYSTCSLEPEENEQVVAAGAGRNAESPLVSLASRIEALLGEGILTPRTARSVCAARSRRRLPAPACPAVSTPTASSFA
jgi:16S rRNA C967 or C1407 C5-methylase (RsmB/RsmF family)